jgi:hypothetical protein
MRTRAKRFLGLSVAMILLATAGIASADDGSVRLTARLDGAQEVPAADPDGSGKAIVDVDVSGGEVCFDIKFDAIGTPTRAHIHEQVAGVNGPIVVTFWELRIPPADPGAPASDPRNDTLEAKRRLSGCTDVADAALLQRIVDNPAGFYVNVHNARFPGGALRCQLEP